MSLSEQILYWIGVVVALFGGLFVVMYLFGLIVDKTISLLRVKRAIMLAYARYLSENKRDN